MATERNRMLLDFAKDWVLDGDLLRCRACKRAHIASRQDEDFIHRSDCKKNRIGGRPWTALQAILTMLPSGGSVVEQLATVTAQRDNCDVANALEGMPPSDSHATVVVCGHTPHREARVIVRGRVVARCDAFDDGLNEAWAGLIAASLNDCINALPVGDEVQP